MNERTLCEEYQEALRRMTAVQLRWLGIDAFALDVVGGLGHAFVQPNDDGTYSPEEGTVSAVIMPVFTDDFDGHCHALGFAPALIDLVAWDPREPSRWWCRIGGSLSDPLFLGAWNLERAMGAPPPGQPDRRAPVALHPSPLAWLRAGCDGAVLVDAGGALWREALDGVTRLLIPDSEFAAFVYKELRRKLPAPPLPEILTPKQGAA